MILEDIAAYKKNQIEKEKKAVSLDEYCRIAEKCIIRDFKAALTREDMAIIGEIKKASPSKGIIKADFDPVKLAKAYDSLEVDAVSVLTESHFFKGSDDYIESTKAVSSKPILRKDFIIDEYQLYQSKAIGADAVLLIAALLGKKLERFYSLAKSIGLQCLVEVHNEAELEAALLLECEIIGINNRDLRDFTVDLRTTERLIKKIPKGILTVSESGIKTPADIRYLKAIGANAALIGETFMGLIEDMDEVKKFIAEARM